jgi:hypothetical protein
MTAPKAPQWPLTPVLRLTALAMLFAAGGVLATGWASAVLVMCAVGLAVVAALKLAAHMRSRRR